MDKKKIFAIILFLVMSLFLFSFANPEDLEFVEYEEEKPAVQPIIEEEPEEPIEEEPVIEEEPQILRPVQSNTNSSSRTNRSSGNTNNTSSNQSSNTNNNNNQTQEQPPVKPAAPLVKATPERVVILLGQDYNVMNGVSVISEENLTVKSNITSVKDLKVGTYTVMYTATDSYNQSGNATRTIVILDPTGDEDNDGYTNQDEYDNNYSYEDKTSHPVMPTLSLKGDNPLIVLKDHLYIEPGYLFTVDSSDEETKEATISGEVNVNTLGNYTLTYRLVDKYGKEVLKSRLVVVKEDINNNNIDDETDEKYTVKFYNFNKEVIKEESVLVGLSAAAPNIEPIDNYVFTGWDKEYTNVQEDLDVYAIYEEDKNNNGIPDSQDEVYSVKFYNIDKRLVKEENVLVGMDATAPVLDAVEKKIFISWDKEYTNVISDLDIYPIYGDDLNENSILDENDTIYTVKFYNINQVLVKEEKVLIGLSATAPTLDSVSNMVFISWDKEYTNVQEDLDIYPIYGEDINGNEILDEIDTRYTVKFFDINKTLVKEENVLVGMDATAPILENVYGYIFSGWSKDYTNVQKDLNVYPIYLEDKNHNGKDDSTEAHYTVTFKTNEYGSLSRVGLERKPEIKYEKILTGLTFEEAGIIVPYVLEAEGYYFVSWDKEINKTVTEDSTYNAVYTYQNGIKAIKKDSNTQLIFQHKSDENAIYDNILVYKTYEGNLKEKELLDKYETDFSTKKKGTFTLTVTSGEFTDTSLSYEIISEKAYSTKFDITYNTTGAYDRCSSQWDYNCTRIIHQPVNYNFIEITESYIGIVIDINSLVVEYTDESKDTFSSSDLGLIRWESTRPNGNKRIPVYKTPGLNDENKTIKYVTINFTKQNKRYYIKFEYVNDEFVAIDGNEND